MARHHLVSIDIGVTLSEVGTGMLEGGKGLREEWWMVVSRRWGSSHLNCAIDPD